MLAVVAGAQGSDGAGGEIAQLAVECGHDLERHGFGAGGAIERVGPGLLDDATGDTGGAKVIAEGLAFLGEGGTQEGDEAGAIDVELAEARVELEADDGGVDVRLWGEGLRRQGEEHLGRGVHLGGGGEDTEVADAGRRGDALGDLVLEHEHGAAEMAAFAHFEELEQDLRRDVVGQVADDVGTGLVGEQAAEISGEHVAFDDGDGGLVLIAQAELGGEVGVEFYGDEAVAVRGEEIGEDTVTGPDLKDGLAGEAAKGVDDAALCVGVAEEVLAELGFGARFHVGLPVEW